MRSHAHQGLDWSSPYTLESRRIIFPVGRTVLDVRTGNGTWLVDGLTAMQFCDAMVYQLRPVAHTPDTAWSSAGIGRLAQMRRRCSACFHHGRCTGFTLHSDNCAQAMQVRMPSLHWSMSSACRAGSCR